ncbi:CG12788 [Drosophila busckii]|uniref:CG12788 n=1 Tax=Drosophila busckii TaxID=30019 RepID=A0A0M3QZK7_DROBS|nr:L-seryl-tRNA(Sec) kinase [Drosophila busckii]ALC49549.1 CG12788 [Drosophila busckii]
MPRICLLALIGLPAAGKTTLSSWLLRHQQHLTDWNVLHLCYDDYFDMDRGTLENIDYRQQRSFIHKLLSQIIDTLRAGPHNLPDKLRYTKSTVNSGNYLLVCDDNHYYRSMRFKIYQLCRSKGCIYSQIYINRSLEQCLLANKLRGAAVPEAVIRQMHNRIEAPSEQECNSLTLCNADFDATSSIIYKFIISLLQKPIEPKALPSTQLKQPQLQSLTHQLDLLLRTRIQFQMRNTPTNLSKETRSSCLNEQRKEILTQFRQDQCSQQLVMNQIDLAYYVNLLN